MHLYGVNGATQGIRVPQQEAPRRVDPERSPVAPLRDAVVTPARPSVLTPAAPSLSAEAPAGTDPELWSVLTTEERAFFAGVGGMGPLTYSHVATSGPQATAVMRGGRLDVRA